MKYDILICTVGTSLLIPNMVGLKAKLEKGEIEERYRSVAEAFAAQAWVRLGKEMGRLDHHDRCCGAEVNSVASMEQKGYLDDDCRLFFLYSDTEAGRNIATVMKAFWGRRAEALQVDDLQDEDPSRFRTKGLRNLAREMCRILRENGHRRCAINATGGYKAQIAIAVLLGQAMNIPVYYKHERFNEIIEFPPMPVSLSPEYWMEKSGMFYDLADKSDPVPFHDYEEFFDNDGRLEALVDRVDIDGTDYIGLSPVGQVFHETFRERFSKIWTQVAPPPVSPGDKKSPKWEASGNMRSNPEIMEYMRKVTREVSFVRRCYTFYFNPDLPSRTLFRLTSQGIEGVVSDGTYTVKFGIETSAVSTDQKQAAVARLNAWLQNQ